LPVTYADFESYGIERHAIGPAIREAVALGFLEITEHGRAGNREFRSPNKFRLTFRPPGPDFGTNEWRLIPSKKEALKVSRAARNERDPRAYRPGKCRGGGNVPRGKKQNSSAGNDHLSVGEKPALKTTIHQCGNPARLPRWGNPHDSRYLGVAREARP